MPGSDAMRQERRPAPSEATQLAREWMSAFSAALDRRDIDSAARLFNDECYWRDLVTFTWNIKTMEGHSSIVAMLTKTLADVRPRSWLIDGEAKIVDGIIEAWFTFETGVALGRGHLRLRNGRCWTLLTTMEALKGLEERRGETRVLGAGHGASRNARTWLEERADEQAALGVTRQPYCVIVGGGQGGIALGARLKRLGVPTIILEKNARPGDSWRKRYKSLVLHDPVWYDHLPYLPFPDDWPVFTPKDKLGDWLESYTLAMELNYWGSSECVSASYDEAAREWTVRVNRNGEEITLHPRQLALATGAYGFPVRPELPGADRFAGEILHSDDYQTGRPFAGKNAVVIGANTSAHDVCADLWRHRANATMIQRSPTTVVKWQTLMELGFAGLYSEKALREGITTEIADHLFASVPFAAMPSQQKLLYEEIARRDADFYAALAKTGFLLDFGEDGSGLMMKALRRAAGYYIEVGASDLIIRGEIKIRSGLEVAEVRQRSVVMSDGSELPADLIVLATGYHSLNVTAAKLISPDVGAKLGPCWGLGSGTKGDPGPWEGELRNMWKPTAQQGLWLHGGNLHLSRYYSKFLALQIKARQAGIPTPIFGEQAGRKHDDEALRL
jgi:putative flavoprotein involved in K+ transport